MRRSWAKGSGWVEGENLVIETRYAGQDDLQFDPAVELARLPVDVIFSTNPAGGVAAKRATTTVPIVTYSEWPVESGLVTSLARPGGNLTAFTWTAPGLFSKWIELLRAIVPGLARLTVLISPTNLAGWQAIASAAETVGIQADLIQIQVAQDVAARSRLRI